jgi:hypothetical protein
MSVLSTALADIFSNPTTGQTFTRLLQNRNGAASTQVVAICGALLSSVRTTPANAAQYAAQASSAINGVSGVGSLGISALVENLAGASDAADVKAAVGSIESALVNNHSGGSGGLLGGLLGGGLLGG